MPTDYKPTHTCCVDPERVQSVKTTMPSEEVLYDTADFFKIFGDSTRLKLLFALAKGELCVGDLSEVVSLSQSAVSHQLRILRQSGAVRFTKRGKTVFYALDDNHVSNLVTQGLEHTLHTHKYD